MIRTLFISLILGMGINLSAQNESVSLHTDRDIYIAGENLYFNLSIQNNSKVPSNIAYVVLRNTQKTILKYYIKCGSTGSYSSLYIPDTLKTGYYEIVAFTNYMRNFSETSFFKKQLIIVNRFDEWLTNLNSPQGESLVLNDSLPLDATSYPLKIKTDKEIYGVREKVKLYVEPGSELPHTDNHYLISVKAYNPYSFLLANKTSEVKETIPVLAAQIKYKPETDRVFVYGRILENGTTPVENECLFISTSDSVPNLQYTFSDRDGAFQYSLNDYYIGKQLLISTRENRNGRYSIVLEDKFALEEPFKPTKIAINGKLRKYIYDCQNIVKVQKAYIRNQLKANASRAIDLKTVPYVYHNPTAVIHPSNFVALNNLPEITQNILEGFKIKSKDGVNLGYMIDNFNWIFFDQPCAVFVNGVYVYNLNPLMNYNSADIKKIELYHSRRIKGNIEFQGIISINTPHKINYPDIIPGCTEFRLENFLEKINYITPQYDKVVNQTSIPDFRQLLYWNPEFDITAQSIDFYTSDWPGEYLVEVKCKNEGKDVSSYSVIKVQKK